MQIFAGSIGKIIGPKGATLYEIQVCNIALNDAKLSPKIEECSLTPFRMLPTLNLTCQRRMRMEQSPVPVNSSLVG